MNRPRSGDWPEVLGEWTGGGDRSAVVVAFVDDYRYRFGVAPICRVLSEHGVPIAPNSYYAHKNCPPSPRSVRDAVVLGEIERLHGDPRQGRGLDGVRKMHAALARAGGVDGRPVSRRAERAADGRCGAFNECAVVDGAGL